MMKLGWMEVTLLLIESYLNHSYADKEHDGNTTYIFGRA